MDNKGSGSYDPGWNDPPVFSYNSQTSHLKSKPRSLLNKRVAFPLNEGSPPTSFSNIPVDPTAPLPTCNISTLPPPPAGSHQVSSHEISSKEKDLINSDSSELPSNALETVINNLTEAVDKIFQNKDKDKDDVMRRLDSMKKLWNDDKLCKDVKHRLLELSEALKNNKMDEADDLQKGLMVDHGSVCSPWMSGIRFLIHHNQTGEDQQ